MRKVLGLVGATLLLAGPATAADLAVKAPVQAPAFMASPWDGLYIGGNVGFGSTDFNTTASVLGASVANGVTGSGVVGGVQAGYNKQFGTFVLGLETDFDGTSISNTTDGASTKLPWFGTRECGLVFCSRLSCCSTVLAASPMAMSNSRGSGPRLQLPV
jgi:opacity protein-like surface antigen